MIPRKSVVTVVLAAALLGCGSSKQSRSAGGILDSSGEALPGVVQIVGVEHGADGKVTYKLSNISGRVQEDLSCSIAFRYPDTAQSAMVLHEWQPTPLRDLVLLKSDTAKEITEANPRPGQKVLETKLTVESTPPVDTVAREQGPPGSGTLFLPERSLECVTMAGEDDVRAGKLWIELENVSAKRVSDLEARVVFIDVDRQGTSRKQAETKWTPVAELDPGKRGKVEFDLAGLGPVGSYKFLVKIRQLSF